MPSFKENVIQIVKKIPAGKVVSYGQVASMAGSPRAARQVGQILKNAHMDSLPWWRVVNSQGQISIKGNFEATKEQQRKLLEAEGVRLSDEFTVVGQDLWRF